jgi:hypothetical protein
MHAHIIAKNCIRTSVRIWEANQATIEVSRYQEGVVATRIVNLEECLDVFIPLSGKNRPEVLQAVRDAWAGKFSAKIWVREAPFLLSFSPELQPEIILAEIENEILRARED